LKIAPFYGCQILRPSSTASRIPTALVARAIIEEEGGEPIDYPRRRALRLPIIQARERRRSAS
jgi:hypothetical protein